jgi:hypothetical protein
MQAQNTVKWFKIREAARYAGVSERLVELWLSAGSIKTTLVRMPGKRRGVRLVNRESLDSFLEAGVGEVVDLEMNRNRKGSRAQ